MAEIVREHEHSAPKESGDLPFLWLYGPVIGWIVFMCLALGMLAVVYYKLGRPTQLPNAEDFPAPRLHAHASEEYYWLVASQKQQLKRYGWVNRADGIVHVPIERAMADLLKRKDPYAPLVQGSEKAKSASGKSAKGKSGGQSGKSGGGKQGKSEGGGG